MATSTDWITDPKGLGQWPTPEWLVERALDTIELPDEGTVLDPACGDGRWLQAVHRRNPRLRLWGWDIAPATLEVRDALVLDDSRADLVVGNPPYVRPQNLAPEQRARAWTFSTATDKVDLYAPFVERMLQLSPRVAIVLADTWLSLSSYAAFREHVDPHLDLVARLPKKAFEATIGTVLLVIDPRARHRRGRLDAEGLVEEGLVRLVDGVFSMEDEVPILEGGSLLGEHLRLRMGVVCGSYREWLHKGPPTIGDVRTCRGREVRRFHIAESREWLRYRPREMLARRPYVAPKSRALFDVPDKVVLAGTSGRTLRCAVDTERRYPLDSCYVSEGAEDSWLLCGLLNSAPVNAWYGARFPAPRVKAVELHRLPWPARTAGIADAARAADQEGLDEAVRKAYGC